MFRALAAGLLDLVAPPRCPGCDLLLGWSPPGFCTACRPLLEPLPGPAAFAYGGPLAEGIRKLKYAERRDLAEPLGQLLAERARVHVGKVDVLVAVPLHPKRLRQRGFDQARLLAEVVARETAIALDPARVTRIRETPPQARLDERTRLANMRGAFVARRDGRARRVLVVDDVRTTGATMQAVAGALHRAGATEVRLLALAGVV